MLFLADDLHLAGFVLQVFHLLWRYCHWNRRCSQDHTTPCGTTTWRKWPQTCNPPHQVGLSTHKHKAVSKLELQESKLDRIPSKSRSVLQRSGLGSTTPEQQGKTVYNSNPHCSHRNNTQGQEEEITSQFGMNSFKNFTMLSVSSEKKWNTVQQMKTHRLTIKQKLNIHVKNFN